MENPVNAYQKDMDSFFYGGNGWQAGLYQLVSDLNFEQASWVPSPGRNSIWKIVKHVNFWKVAILSDSKGKPLTGEERQAGDWRNIPEKPSEELWKQEVIDLKNIHEEFKDYLKQFGTELFNPGNDDANFFRENINHDSYHAGQIGLLRILQGIQPIKYN